MNALPTLLTRLLCFRYPRLYLDLPSDIMKTARWGSPLSTLILLQVVPCFPCGVHLCVYFGMNMREKSGPSEYFPELEHPGTCPRRGNWAVYQDTIISTQPLRAYCCTSMEKSIVDHYSDTTMLCGLWCWPHFVSGLELFWPSLPNYSHLSKFNA